MEKTDTNGLHNGQASDDSTPNAAQLFIASIKQFIPAAYMKKSLMELIFQADAIDDSYRASWLPHMQEDINTIFNNAKKTYTVASEHLDQAFSGLHNDEACRSIIPKFTHITNSNFINVLNYISEGAEMDIGIAYRLKCPFDVDILNRFFFVLRDIDKNFENIPELQ
jgi:hypothetical protein